MQIVENGACGKSSHVKNGGMTKNQNEIIKAMMTYGGSFMARLADAWLHADSTNRAKIETTWATEWDKYRRVFTNPDVQDDFDRVVIAETTKNGRIESQEDTKD